MSTANYLVLAAILFTIGAVGVLVRRNAIVVFIPFLVLDMLVSASLMAMGMMMVPPSVVALPFKLLLFVMVDGWALITTALVGSYT